MGGFIFLQHALTCLKLFLEAELLRGKCKNSTAAFQCVSSVLGVYKAQLLPHQATGPDPSASCSSHTQTGVFIPLLLEILSWEDSFSQTSPPIPVCRHKFHPTTEAGSVL